MTVASTDNREVFNGNGVTVAFAFPRKFFLDADLKVYVDGVLNTLSTDYTVSGAGDENGGTVTFLVAPPSGTGNVVILRDPAATQERDFVENDPLPVEEVENALDLLTMLIQRLKELQGRSFTLSDADTDASLQIPPASARALKALVFDEMGNVGVSSNDFDTAASAAINAATTATTQAGIATTQAGIATTKAGEAATSAIAAAASAATIDVSTLVKRDGSQAMTGPLGLAGNAVDELHAVPKRQLDAAVAAAIPGGSKNLLIVNNAMTPTSKVGVSAGEVVLKDSTGRGYLAKSVSLTIDITASGANGLDSGSEAASTWYYAWLIYNGSAVAGLLSTSSSAPALPSGYTYKAFVGAIYNDSGSNFISLFQVGNEAFTDDATVTTTLPTTSYVSVSLAAFIPPVAKIAKVNATAQGGASLTTTIQISSTSTGGIGRNFRFETGGSTSYRTNAGMDIPMQTAQTLWYQRTGSALNTFAMYCNGWKF